MPASAMEKRGNALCEREIYKLDVYIAFFYAILYAVAKVTLSLSWKNPACSAGYAEFSADRARRGGKENG